MKAKLLKIALGAALLAGTTFTAHAGTLDVVKGRGVLACGVTTGSSGLSRKNEKGQWNGFDVDYCRAMAAAILGDANKVEFLPLTAKEKFAALQSGAIDVLSNGSVWTLTREADLGITFVTPTLYDQQGFMVQKSLGVKSGDELDGARICLVAATTSVNNVADYFRARAMKYKSITFDTIDQTGFAFERGRCDVVAGNTSVLSSMRRQFKNPSSAVILPTVISTTSLGAYVRKGDTQWLNIARWTHFAMVNAEELEITSINVDAQRTSRNPKIKRALGTEGDLAKGLGLSKDWASNIIKQVGNYGEIYDKNLGSNSPMNMQRGLNALWTNSGLQRSPSMR